MDQELLGKLLIASPGLEDIRFQDSVILICEHSKKATMGLILNKPLYNFDTSQFLIKIKIILNLRIELLGLNFIPQHSDARVTDQLLYKWPHFKALLSKVLYNHYNDIKLKNFKISENQISDDVSKLLLSLIHI